MLSFIEFFEGFPVLPPVSPANDAASEKPKSCLEQPGVWRRRRVTEIGEIVEQLPNGTDANDRDQRRYRRGCCFGLNRR